MYNQEKLDLQQAQNDLYSTLRAVQSTVGAQFDDITKGIGDAESVQARSASDPSGADDEATRERSLQNTGEVYARGRLGDLINTLQELKAQGLNDSIARLQAIHDRPWNQSPPAGTAATSPIVTTPPPETSTGTGEPAPVEPPPGEMPPA